MGRPVEKALAELSSQDRYTAKTRNRENFVSKSSVENNINSTVYRFITGRIAHHNFLLSS